MAGNGMYIAGEKIGGANSYNIYKYEYKKINTISTASVLYNGHTSGTLIGNGYNYFAVKAGTDIYVSDDISGTNINQLTNLDISNISVEDPYWVYSFYNSSTKEFNIYCIRIADYPSNFSVSIISGNDSSNTNCAFAIKVSVRGTLPNVGTQGGLLEDLGIIGFLKYNNKYMSFNSDSAIMYKNFSFQTGNTDFANVTTPIISGTKGEFISKTLNNQYNSGDNIINTFGDRGTTTISRIYLSLAASYSSGTGTTTITLYDGGTSVTLTEIRYGISNRYVVSTIGNTAEEVIEYA